MINLHVPYVFDANLIFNGVIPLFGVIQTGAQNKEPPPVW